VMNRYRVVTICRRKFGGGALLLLRKVTDGREKKSRTFTHDPNKIRNHTLGRNRENGTTR